MKLVLASNNRKKIAELETFFAARSSKVQKVDSLADIGWTEDIVEDGESFEENSLIKARVPASLGMIGLADDSGLVVDALGGQPGIYSARYAGEEKDDAKNRKKLLDELRGIPEEDRTARFVCVLSAVFPPDCDVAIPEEWRISQKTADKLGIDRDHAISVRGECEGIIGFDEAGEGGFGYDSLFFYPPFGQTFAEIGQEQKNAVSHRGSAMRSFTARLSALLDQIPEK